MSKYSTKQLRFNLILISIPFIVLLLLELVLRLSSFGGEYPLFIDKATTKNQQSLYLQPNPKVVNRYFADEKLAPKVSPDTVYFKKEKNKNSFRIFIQGGSTAAGFPYGRWGSLQGMLEQRFKRLYPNKDIEIINTAMAAVNSYTLLDFVDEIIAQKPDLILIYAGHNEYLGIMGVGSAYAAKGGRFATLLHLKFKNWRLYQLLQKIFYLTLAADEPLTKANQTLMSRVAREKEIEIGSDLYLQGVAQFKYNMSMILEKYQEAGIPVVLGNLVSNERGQVPFSSVGKVDWVSYKSNLDVDNALGEIARLNGLISQDKKAEYFFQLALNLELLGRYKEAKNAYVLAKDFDLLRFRAPSEFNNVIANLAKTYAVDLLNVEESFSVASINKIIGNELILEHLHPTVEGYFLLAESYVELINKQNFINAKPDKYSREKARLDIPVSTVDKLYGEFVIAKLMNDFPFTLTTATTSNEAKKQPPLPSTREFEKQALIKRINKKNWLEIQKDLLVKYQQKNEIAEAAKIAGAISTAMIENHNASYIAGQLYQQLNDWQMASYYHHKAVQQQDENVQYLLALAQDYFLLKTYSQSLEMLKKANDLVNESSSQKQQIKQYIVKVKQAMSLRANKQ